MNDFNKPLREQTPDRPPFYAQASFWKWLVLPVVACLGLIWAIVEQLKGIK